MRTLSASLVIICLSACLGACGFVGFPGVYKINVEQGNIVDQEMADQLKPGMSRRQVKFIMGTPLVEDTFNQDRWDYPYVKRNGRNVLSESRMTVIFEGDSLLSVEGDYLPPAWSDPNTQETPSTAEEESTDAEPAEQTRETAG
jgi:outer membrane protein assembly factor BamE